MKNLFWLSLSLLFLIACEPEAQFGTISGTIENAQDEYVLLWQGDDKDTLFLDENASFSHQVEIQQPGYFFLQYGRERAEIYMDPGTNLNIQFNDSSLRGTLLFEGSAAGTCNYLKMLNDLKGEIDFIEIYKLDPDAFEKKIAELRDTEDQRLNELKKEYQLSKDFMIYQKIKNQAGWGIQRLRYPRYHEYYTKSTKPELKENYYDFVSSIEINNPDLYRIREIKVFADSYISYLTNKQLEDSTIHPDEANGYVKSQVQAILTAMHNKELSEKLLYESVNDQIKYNGPADMEPILDTLHKYVKNQEYLDQISTALAEWESLLPGQPAPNWIAYDMEGKEYQLADFAGKYLYIDVWATWCGPCKREIPFLEQLIEEMHGYNINFLSISVDKDKSRWEQMVIEENMTGNQLFAEGDFNSELTINYKIKAIPRFILIDPEGLMINVSAERPSGKIKNILLSLQELLPENIQNL